MDMEIVLMNYMRVLSQMGIEPDNESIYPLLSDSHTIAEEELILNDYVYLLENKKIEPFTLKQTDFPFAYKIVDWRIEYINSLK